MRTVGPVAIKTSSGQSGGFAAGLESNGRLASDQPARHRKIKAGPQCIARKAQCARIAAPGHGRTAFTRSSFQLLPNAGPPDGAVPRRRTGTERLPDLTNAKSVASTGYLDAKGIVSGTALLIETRGVL